MATHKVKAGNVAQLWDKPEAGRTNKGQLQAGTLVTVSVTRAVDGILYHQLVSHNNWWSKASWFEALPVSPPPPPTGTTPPETLPSYFTAHDESGNILGTYRKE